MMATPTRVAVAVVAGALLVPAGAAAQTCGVATSIAAVGGYADYDIAGGTGGPAIGADVTVDAGTAGLRLGVRTIVLEGDAPDPLLARAQAALPVTTFAGWAVCGDIHAGVSQFSFSDDSGTVLAGGLGLTVAPAAPGTIRPWISVRGLAGWATGRILDFDVSETGLSVGVEAGITARAGPLSVRLAGARDGFAGGLGTTPYPALSAELAVGYHF